MTFGECGYFKAPFIAMDKKDPLISFLTEERILNEEALQTALQECRDTGRSLISVLKKENLLNEDELSRVVARANDIEFVSLSPEMIDPMAAHFVP